MTRRFDLRPQPCGHCGKPVPPGPGRRPGLVWWHKGLTCQRARSRDQYARDKAKRGRPAPLPLATCGLCGDEYRPRTDDPVVTGICNARRACKRERDRRYQLVWSRAARQLAAEHPDRMTALMAAEAARVGAEPVSRAA